MEKIIAKASFFGQHPGEEHFEITVEIGTPYQCSEEPEEWACPIAVRPLYSRLHGTRGIDSLQSLCLAISLAQNLLQDFREKGGLLTFENGETFPLESYSFGINSG